MERIRLVAKGSVQGVGFRSFVVSLGERLSLVGFAKNLHDGTVEIVAEGDEGKIREFRSRVNMKNPLGIRVDELKTLEQTSIQEKSFASFSVAY